MYINIYYLNIKKEKKDYILLCKSETQDIDFNEINSMIHKNLNDTTNSNANYYELYYLKKGVVLDYTEDIWKKCISLYLEKIDIKNIIDVKYVKKIKENNIILYSLNEYEYSLKQYLIYNHINN